MIVVSDTSPLNYPVLIGHVEVLPRLFVCVVAPPAVISEMLHSGAPTPIRDWAAKTPPWLEVVAPTVIRHSLPLGPGEVEALSLAQELHSDAILIDERKASVVELAGERRNKPASE
jgi:predicted nucleic acid-binding protein